EPHPSDASCASMAGETLIAEARLGLTAPPPQDEAGARRLAELVGRTAYELTVGDLAGSFLSHFDSVTLHLELPAGQRQAYERWMTVFRAVGGALQPL